MRITNKIIILILFLFIGCPAYAGFQAGLSTNYLKVSDDYKHNTNFNNPNFNLGYNYSIQPLLITATTNRLFNQTSEQPVSKNGLTFTSKTKIIADTIMIGYPIKRTILGLLASNVGVKKSLYRDNRFIGKTEQHAILGGIYLAYNYDKDLNLYTAFIAPNKRLDLDYGVSVGVNYNFNLLK